ncbi:hypothetical protein L596_011927 [Steinernema carpocapsae]|uniref:Uncharacterized protein n=1 Tax=Steinernema carpocapsae TaxID=34508 RepID=A0A4U5NW74_STECR|nr:hypothetical protein L596_011927 [Steinernema carpocapsae]
MQGYLLELIAKILRSYSFLLCEQFQEVSGKTPKILVFVFQFFNPCLDTSEYRKVNLLSLAFGTWDMLDD